jgi:hypothetical protein
MANDATELREHLFATLKGLKDKSIDIDQAKAMCEVSRNIIDLAKVEVDMAKVTGADISGGFLAPEKPAITGSTVHRLRG